MRTRLLLYVLLIGSIAACAATPTAPLPRASGSPVMDTDSTGAVTGTPGGGQLGSGSGG